jgi:hypothetical protein
VDSLLFNAELTTSDFIGSIFNSTDQNISMRRLQPAPSQLHLCIAKMDHQAVNPNGLVATFKVILKNDVEIGIYSLNFLNHRFVNQDGTFFQFNEVPLTFEVVDSTSSVSSISTKIDRMTISPNPSSEFANLTINSAQNETVTIQVIDALGKVISSEGNVFLKVGENKINLNDKMPKTSGVFAIRKISPSGYVETAKWIVEK